MWCTLRPCRHVLNVILLSYEFSTTLRYDNIGANVISIIINGSCVGDEIKCLVQISL